MRDPRTLVVTVLRGVEPAKRIAVARMTRGRAGAGRVPNETMAENCTQRAAAGLLIANPDLVGRHRKDWSLADDAPREDGFTPKGAEGHTDIPTYPESNLADGILRRAPGEIE